MAASVVLLSPAVAGIIFGQGFWAVWTNFCHGFSRSAEYVWQILATRNVISHEFWAEIIPAVVLFRC